jgi:hypothetical protein
MAKEEADIQRAIIETLRSMNIFAFRNHSQGIKLAGRGRVKNPNRGAPDILAIIPPKGIFLGIEVKKPGGKPSPEQLQWIDDIRANGGIAFVCDDVNQLKTLLATYLPT